MLLFCLLPGPDWPLTISQYFLHRPLTQFGGFLPYFDMFGDISLLQVTLVWQIYIGLGFICMFPGMTFRYKWQKSPASSFYTRDAGNPILNTLSKLLQPFPQLARDQQVPGYNSSFEWLIQSYDCKQIPVGQFRLAKCHHPDHPGWCKIFRVWEKWCILHIVFCWKFSLLSQFSTFVRGKSSWKCREY